MQIKPSPLRGRRRWPSSSSGCCGAPAVTARCLGGALTLAWGIAVSISGWILLSARTATDVHGTRGVPPMAVETTQRQLSGPSWSATAAAAAAYAAASGSVELPSWAVRGDHHNLAAVPQPGPAADEWDATWPPIGACYGFDSSVMRPRHGCQVNKMTRTVFCNFENLRIDTSKIDVARGGEVLSTVMGRGEEAELPVYRRGAFTVPVKPAYDVPAEYRDRQHYLGDILNAMRYPTKKNNYTVDLACETTLEGTTLLLTRYEYVNLYHTLTDWWNAHSVLPEGYHERPHRVVFLDGHAQGGLDPAWGMLFGDHIHVQHLPPGGVCMERAVFVPSGYNSPLYPDLRRRRCVRGDLAAAFSEFVVRQRFHLDHVRPVRGRVVLVDRQAYVSHPRSDPAAPVRRAIGNMDELEGALARVPGVDLRVVRLEALPFAEQIRTVREAHVLVASHGAALSHLMFMDWTRSHVLEFTADYTDFFYVMAQWKGISHEFIDMGNDGVIPPQRTAQAVERVQEFLMS